MKNKNYRISTAIALTIVIGLVGIFLPGIVLNATNTSILNIAATLPAEYYSNTTPTISRNASSQLSDYQKMMLISGAWESETKEADVAESTLTEYEAVNMAQQAIDNLYNHNNYPCTLDSGFKNWYTWTATLYKATESNFHTYAAYYWKLTFDRYDAKEHHTILMTEDGTVLCAYTNIHYLIVDSIADYLSTDSEYASKSSFVNFTGDATTLPRYQNIEIPEDHLRVKSSYVMVVGNRNMTNMSQVREDYDNSETSNEFYCIHQLISEYVYMYTMIPYQP